jgi:uncharacterized protein with HEPN domain
MRKDRDRLLDILEAIEKIRSRVPMEKREFMRDELIQVWCVHHIQIIGEAASKISDYLRNQHTQIPWQDIIAMRNIMVHQYFGIDLQEIWNTVNIDLTLLENQVKEIMNQMG